MSQQLIHNFILSSNRVGVEDSLCSPFRMILWQDEVTNFRSYSRLRFEVKALTFSGVVDDGTTLARHKMALLRRREEADMVLDVILSRANIDVLVVKRDKLRNEGRQVGDDAFEALELVPERAIQNMMIRTSGKSSQKQSGTGICRRMIVRIKDGKANHVFDKSCLLGSHQDSRQIGRR